MLRLEVAMEPNTERQDRNPQERRAERLAQAAEVRRRVVVLRRRWVGGGGARQRRVQPEQLRDCDADARERERGAQPGEEGAF